MTDHPLPLLNLSDFTAGGERCRAFLHALRAASRDVGFFYLTGHGIPGDLQEAVMETARSFFALPDQAKEEVRMVNSPHFRGYTRIGGELTRGQADWREQFDVMREAQVVRCHYGEAPWLRLYGPNQWPSALPRMRELVLDWQDRLTGVTLTLLRAFALALEQDAGVFDESVGEVPFQHLKLIRYPGRDTTLSDQGVGEHKDSGYLTLVLQDDTPGLEVLTDRGWVLATPVPGSFVVNIGELLELASNGYLKATLHRVVTPPAGVTRYSSAFFMGARLDADVPLLDLPGYLAREAKGPSSDPLNPLFHQVGRNVLKGRLRSHVDVANAHYGELEPL
ncbi:isopenicillin N synthase family dioxygenase [Paludibacterium paludis]|uniref:2-oxobutyrate oxidase n=1 Tax=Paludibacterium paludis TaxID=1225769 RepID=A0A918UBM7_9NEIS|nr:isopenicillin N synthase family oxygenase [Paludibacterium paludis]GGY24243.1 2-oxobutyrate oxidase [Paludibacterium paludis]